MLKKADQADVVRRQKYDDLRWARRNQRLQKKYEGQLIVVHKRRVLAHGYDEVELVNQVANDRHPRDELVILEMLPADFQMPPQAF